MERGSQKFHEESARIDGNTSYPCYLYMQYPTACFQKQISEIHDNVTKGEVDVLANVQACKDYQECNSKLLVQDTRLLLSRDYAGVSPILKAAKLGHLNIVNLILTKLPQAAKSTDSVTFSS